MNATDHDIYRQRGKMNIQIGFLLGAVVLLIMVATIARLANGPDIDEANLSPAREEAQN